MDIWETVLRYALCGIVGYAAGTIIAYRHAKVGGVRLVVPFVPKSSRNFTIVVLTLAVVSAFSVITGQLQQSHARQCEVQFRDAITAQARINAEDRGLEAEDDELRNRRDDALDVLVDSLIRGAQSGQGLRALQEYYDEVETINAAQEDLVERRGELQEARNANPYPSPTCD